MYTWEIEKIVEENNGVLESKIYLTICETSPQITEVRFEAFSNLFKIWTNDKLGEISFNVVCNKN